MNYKLASQTLDKRMFIYAFTHCNNPYTVKCFLFLTCSVGSVGCVHLVQVWFYLANAFLWLFSMFQHLSSSGFLRFSPDLVLAWSSNCICACFFKIFMWACIPLLHDDLITDSAHLVFFLLNRSSPVLNAASMLSRKWFRAAEKGLIKRKHVFLNFIW